MVFVAFFHLPPFFVVEMFMFSTPGNEYWLITEKPNVCFRDSNDFFCVDGLIKSDDDVDDNDNYYCVVVWFMASREYGNRECGALEKH